MKKGLALLAFVIVISSCDGSAKRHSPSVIPPTPKVGMSESELLELLGEPITKDVSPDGSWISLMFLKPLILKDAKSESYEDGGFQVLLKNNRVTKIQVIKRDVHVGKEP